MLYVADPIYVFADEVVKHEPSSTGTPERSGYWNFELRVELLLHREGDPEACNEGAVLVQSLP